MVNELSKALSVAEMKVQYDVQCRKVLAQKEVLAWILKNTAVQYQLSCFLICHQSNQKTDKEIHTMIF